MCTTELRTIERWYLNDHGKAPTMVRKTRTSNGDSQGLRGTPDLGREGRGVFKFTQGTEPPKEPQKKLVIFNNGIFTK